MKIAIELDDDRNIIGIVSTDDHAVQRQAKIKGWILVDSDPTFLIDEKNIWTVRESDNTLVHVSTGKTPDEENKDALADLTKQNLAGQLMDNQFQQAITAMTKQAIQDKATSQMAITDLTKQVADLTVKLDKANGVNPVPETPADVTSTATADGATITAK